MALFVLDGKTYNVFVQDGGLSRTGQIAEGGNSGQLKSGRMIRDIIGTYYNYALTIDTNRLSEAEYDALYEVLSAPVNFHVVTFPYGQGTLTFDAYITGVSDVLQSAADGVNRWGKLKVSFAAMAPQRR